MDYPPLAKVNVGPDRVVSVVTSRPRPYYCRADTVQLTPGNLTVDPASGLTSIVVKFKTVLKDANWVFSSLTFWNVGDADLDVVQLAATGRTLKSASGFTLLLAGQPPTPNYYLDWAIAERYNP